MRKVQTCVLVLGAVFVLSGLVVSSAMAEETLLAEWLVNGAGVAAAVNWKDPGEFRFGDKNALTPVKVQCSLIERGTLEANGAGFFTEILTLGEVLVNSAAPALCKRAAGCEESATNIEAFPTKLPWKLLAFLGAGGEFLETVEGESWHFTCFVLGLKQSDECTFTAGTQFELLNVAGGVEVMGTGKPFGTCSIGGALAFESEQLSESGDESTTGTLTVSE